jgi:hypothetical protein
MDKAKTHLQEAANMDVNHQGVQVHLSMINEQKIISQ